MITTDEILNSKGIVTQGEDGTVSHLPSWLGSRKDYTGLCIRGPFENFTLSDANPIVKMDRGAYRHLDGKWWWTPLA